MWQTGRFRPSREILLEQLLKEAREGDLILIMGARDPSLTQMAQNVLRALANNKTGQKSLSITTE